MTHFRTLVVAIGVMIPSFALAQQSNVRGACLQDVKSLCGSVQPGGGRIVRCMRENRAKLSEGCKMALAERMMQRRQEGGGRGLQGRPNAPTQKPDQDL